MNIKIYKNQKLSHTLFITVKAPTINNIFKTKFLEDMDLPLHFNSMEEMLKAGQNLDSIPVAILLEGMSYVLGLDDNFKYENDYIKILQGDNKFLKHLKGKIYRLLEEKNIEEAYYILRGISKVESTEENFLRLFMLLEELRIANSIFLQEEKQIIEELKVQKDYAITFLYEAIICQEEGDYERAFNSINIYSNRRNELSDEENEIYNSIGYDFKLHKALENLQEDPKTALTYLLELLEKNPGVKILYYIGVAYRNLGLYQKAIYYLNEALNLDPELVDVVNELGINYACIGDFDSALYYLKSAFKASRSVEICTNIIMCLLNQGNILEAKNNLDLAKKLAPEDEIVISLEKEIKGIMSQKSDTK